MGDESVRKVAILGGGMGALAAAFELSAPERKGRYGVTVYPMGWRLGGKCASARNAERGLRSEEHGLHVWFGFYENAFGLMRRTYEALGRPASHPFRDVGGVFMPRQLASFGSRADDGGPWTVSVPTTPGAPWSPQRRTPAEVVALFVEKILDAIGQWSAHRAEFVAGPRVTLGSTLGPSSLLDGFRRTSEKLRRTRRLDEETMGELRRALAEFQSLARDTLLVAAGLSATFRQLWVALDLALAMLSGLLDPRDRVLVDGDLGRLDDREFRDWLRAHGAWEVNVWAPPIRALYDAAFAYRDGDPRKPAFAAGVAMRVVLRVAFDYSGSIFYLPRAGFGEVIVQPLYELLSRRGVRFEFFHRVDLLEGDARQTRVERVRLTRQARTVGDAPYRPLITVQVPKAGAPPETFDAWPSTPDWKQLVNGDAMKEANVNFESRWYDQKAFPGEPLVLERGQDFDDVILGIPLHAAREVLRPFADHPVLGPALEEITPVPTVSAQVWLDTDAAALGWTTPPGLVGAPPHHDIWTDMTQVLDHEPWPAGAEPTSLQYMCGVAPLARDVWAPPDDLQVPARALDFAERALKRFLVDASWAVWPGLGPRGTPFKWNLLHDATGQVGEARLQAQYARANVDPTECCSSSLPGAIDARPTAGTSGVENLLLAGESVRTGLDTSCVESAVMAGRQAARALGGLRYRVPGEDFLAKLPPDPVRTGGGGGGGALPPYVPWLGLGQQSIRSPVDFDGCTAWVCPLAASQKTLQDLVDAKLNTPSNGALNFQVPFGAVLLTFLYGAKGVTTTEPIGSSVDKEMGFAVPLTYVQDGNLCLAFWMPYITVDTSIAMASGRETWGFPKEKGEVNTPAGGTLDAQSSVLRFSALNNATAGSFGPIVTLVDDHGLPPLPLTGVEWIEALIAFLVATLGAVGGGLPLIAELTALLTQFTELPIVNLKQFRDVEDDALACYQAIALTAFQFPSVGACSAAVNAAHCEITSAASHDFVDVFGISGAVQTATGWSVPAPLTLIANFDFAIADGTILWQAGT